MILRYHVKDLETFNEKLLLWPNCNMARVILEDQI